MSVSVSENMVWLIEIDLFFYSSIMICYFNNKAKWWFGKVNDMHDWISIELTFEKDFNLSYFLKLFFLTNIDTKNMLNSTLLYFTQVHSFSKYSNWKLTCFQNKRNYLLLIFNLAIYLFIIFFYYFVKETDKRR